MNINNISSKYIVKNLTDKDIPNILNLSKENHNYYKYMKIQPTYENIKESLTALPKNKTIDDKFFIGFYKNNNLIAILDLIIKYPNENYAFIGWFILDKNFQGKGIGSEIINELINFLKYKFEYIKLGYIKGNLEAEKFWLKNKFIPTGKEIQTENYIIIVMERQLF